MRNKFWNRVLIALSGLLIFAAGVLLFLISFLSLFNISLSLGGAELSQLLGGLAVWQKILLMLGGAAVAALGLHDISIPFPSRRERGFIMQHTELGDMSISMNALETMVQQLRSLVAPGLGAAPVAAAGSVDTSPRLDLIAAQTPQGVTMVPIEQVCYFEAADKYVRVVTADQEHLIRLSLKHLAPR